MKTLIHACTNDCSSKGVERVSGGGRFRMLLILEEPLPPRRQDAGELTNLFHFTAWGGDCQCGALYNLHSCIKTHSYRDAHDHCIIKSKKNTDDPHGFRRIVECKCFILYFLVFKDLMKHCM